MVTLAANVALGTVPDWIAAIGTAGALMAAVVVLAFEVASRRRERETIRRKQAELVAVWLRSADPGRRERTPGAAGVGDDDRKEWLVYRAHVLNRSDLPVFAALVRAEWDDLPGSHHTVVHTIAPGATLDVDVRVASRPVISSFPRVSIGFRDVGGLVWHRWDDGTLLEGSWSHDERPPSWTTSPGSG